MTDVIDRIRKMIAMAEHQGGNDSEMKNAMKMASDLMMKHGITRDQVDHVTPKVIEGSTFPISYDWYIWAVHAVKELFGVEGLFYSGVGPKKMCAYIGRPENVEAAENTFAYIVLQVEAAYKQALPRGMTQKHRAEYRKHFKVTCAQRVYQRAAEIVKHQTTDDLTGSGGGTALVVLGHREQLANEVEEFMRASHPEVKRKTRKRSKGKVGMAGIEAMFAGQRAGDAVDLNRPTQKGRIT